MMSRETTSRRSIAPQHLHLSTTLTPSGNLIWLIFWLEILFVHFTFVNMFDESKFSSRVYCSLRWIVMSSHWTSGIALTQNEKRRRRRRTRGYLQTLTGKWNECGGTSMKEKAKKKMLMNRLLRHRTAIKKEKWHSLMNDVIHLSMTTRQRE